MTPQRSILATECPRLYEAIQARRAREAALPAARAEAMAEVVRLDALVAHRDLQLVRSFARCKKRGKEWGKYLRERQTKLKEAQRAHARAQKRVPKTWEDIPA